MKKSILFLFLIFGLVFSTSGTTTMQWPESAFFVFSSAETTSYDDAILISGNPLEYFDISLEPWNAPAWCANYIDMGEASLDSLQTPPSSGYSDDVQGFFGCDYVQQGHAYWIKTREGDYAKVKITEAVYLGVDPENGNTNRITFNWVYLGGGGTTGGDSGKDNENNGFCPVSISLILLSFASLFIIRH